jgi:hypothetical protein
MFVKSTQLKRVISVLLRPVQFVPKLFRFFRQPGIFLFTIASLFADPLSVRQPQVFTETVSVQVDGVAIGSNLSLETCNRGVWQKVASITNATAPSVVFCLPLTTNKIFRAYANCN